MSELFLERSADVLDEWEIVKQDGNLSDTMRWAPDAQPRLACECPYCVTMRTSDGHRLLFFNAWIQDFNRQRRRWKPERRAAARQALAMRRRSVIYDPATDTLLLPDGCRVDAAVATANLLRAFDSLDPFSYPMPTQCAAEYHRRRRARARRRRR